MANCSKCGYVLKEGQVFCGSCGASRLSSSSQSTYSSYGNFVKLSENEVRIKTYHCTTLKKPKGEGYITITNKRVVFHGYGNSSTGSSKLVSDVPIETVSGIRTYYGTGLNILALIFGIIFSIPTLIMLFNSDFGIFAKYSSKAVWIPFLICLGLAIFFLRRCKQGSYYLSIFSSGANGSPISIGDGSLGGRLTGQGALMTVVATPAADTQELMQEIGAIIMDFKSMGDHAIEKWAPNLPQAKCNNSESTNFEQTPNTASQDKDEEFFK